MATIIYLILLCIRNTIIISLSTLWHKLKQRIVLENTLKLKTALAIKIAGKYGSIYYFGNINCNSERTEKKRICNCSKEQHTYIKIYSFQQLNSLVLAWTTHPLYSHHVQVQDGHHHFSVSTLHKEQNDTTLNALT